MSEAPAVRVLKFVKLPEMRPMRGDPSSENVDAKGFLVDQKGGRKMQLQHVDWVYYAPPTAMGPFATIERVEHVIPDPVFMRNSPDSLKARFMQMRWDAIKPHYEAWMIGQETPMNGTALGAWPGLTQEQANAFRSLGIRTVEEVRDITEGQVDRIPLPNVRELRRQAAAFIANIGSAVSAERERQKDQVIADMAATLAEMREELAKTRTATIDTQTMDEVEQLRAELDSLGIAYDRRWAAPKLRSALSAETAEAA